MMVAFSYHFGSTTGHNNQIFGYYIQFLLSPDNEKLVSLL